MFQWLAHGGTLDEYLENFAVGVDSARTVLLTAGHNLSRSVEQHLTVPSSEAKVRSASTQ